MKKFALVIVLILLALLAVAGFALAGNGHDHGCKSWWKCNPVSTVTTSTTATAPAVTVTTTLPAQIDTTTVTQTVTTPAPPPTVYFRTKTVVKTVVKKVRRYCTRQRHGWRCGPTAPHQKPIKG